MVRRVAIAIDRSHHSVDTFNWYVQQVRMPGDVVGLIHCVEPAIVQTVGAYPLYGLDPLVVGIYAQLDEDNRNSARRLLHRAGAILEKKEIEHELLFCEGYPKDKIMEALKVFRPSLLIVGCRGMNAFERIMGGSISDYLVHNAGCPVLVYKKSHEKKREEAAPESLKETTEEKAPLMTEEEKPKVHSQ